MGMNTAFVSLGRVAGPLWAGFSFDVNISYPFISGAITLAVAFVISLIFLHVQPRHSSTWQDTPA